MSEETASATEKDDDARSKIAKEVHRSLSICAVNSSTHVFVVAINKNPAKNFVNRITCKRAMPIGGYVYDSQSDSYIVECADFLNLGTVPVAFMQSQKNELKKFKSHFRSDEYEIDYIQLIDPNV